MKVMKDIPSVGPCSKMLYIKNKATQLLMIKNFRPSKHYLLSGIMILRRRAWMAYLHHLSKYIQMKVHKIQKNVNNVDIKTNYLYSHFINVSKYSQYLYYINTFGLSEGENVRVTSERLQFGLNSTGVLFIYL